MRERIVQACLAAFIVGIALSMAAYPGGTWWTPTRQGHAFWGNFLCDLLHDPALNHESNRTGALWAQASMLVFIVGLGVFWSMTERWLRRGRVNRLVRNLGVFGTLPLAMVPLTPSNRFPGLHTAAVLLGGLPELIAFLLFCAALFHQRRTSRWWRVLTACLCLLIVVCLGLYAQGAVGGGPSLRVLPVLERGAVILLLVWLLVMVHQRSHGQARQ